MKNRTVNGNLTESFPRAVILSAVEGYHPRFARRQSEILRRALTGLIRMTQNELFALSLLEETIIDLSIKLTLV